MLCVFLIVVITYLPVYAQVDTSWVRTYNGTGNSDDEAWDIAVDDSGNVYVTGYSTGPDANVDYATIKYNANGNIIWVKRYNGVGDSIDVAYSIAVDQTQNAYVTGMSSGIGTDLDFLTIKYAPNGDTLWTRRYNGPGNDEDVAKSIVVHSSGDIYVAGYSIGIGTSYDYTTIKYNSSGDQIWVSRYNGPDSSEDIAASIAIDAVGNSYVTGYGRDVGTNYNYTTIKYNSLGAEQWVKIYDGGDLWDYAYAIAVDSAANVYITGESDGDLTSFIDPDYVTIKYNTSGATQWVRRYNAGTGNLRDIAYAITVDRMCNVYVTGQSSNSFNDDDYATIKYNSSGNVQWVRRYNGSGNGEDEAYSIAVDDSTNIYVTGYSSNGPGINYDYATVKYNTNGDTIWIARYNGPTNGEDGAHSLVVDDLANVYITGRSSNLGFGLDYATIKYTQTSGIEEYLYGEIGCDILKCIPNLSRSQLTIYYSVPNEQFISIEIFDIAGRLLKTVVQDIKGAGSYYVIWNGKDNHADEVSSGIYFCIMKNSQYAVCKKIFIAR